MNIDPDLQGCKKSSFLADYITCASFFDKLKNKKTSRQVLAKVLCREFT